MVRVRSLRTQQRAKSQCTCTTPVWVGRQRTGPHDGFLPRSSPWLVRQPDEASLMSASRTVSLRIVLRLHIDIQWRV